MKTIFFSDVHGVATAFQTFLRELDREAPDQTVFLGDLLTLGPSPAAVADLYFRRPFTAIRGNHDEFLGDQALAEAYTGHREVLDSLVWTREALGPEVLGKVAGFGAPKLVDLGRGFHARCYHGTPESSTEIVTEGGVSRLADGEGTGAALWIGGHIHTPFLVRRRGVLFGNSGSCGMPFSDSAAPGLPQLLPQADYVVVETGRGDLTVTLRSLELDKGALRREIRASDHPLARYALDQYRLGPA